MSLALRIGVSLIVVLLASGVASYVERRASWAFGLSRSSRRALASVVALGIVAALVSRALGSEHAQLALALGMFGGATLLGLVISSVFLLPVDIAQLAARKLARARGRAPASSAPAVERQSEPAPDAPSMPERRAFLARAAAGGAITLGMGSAFYGTLFGRHDYSVETVPIRLAKLPRALDGLSIVQLSDIHVGTFVGERELAAALELVGRARPDLVVLTGDLIDHEIQYAPMLARFTRALKSCTRYGVFAVPGNHDHYAGAATVMRMLGEAGTEVLLNRHVRIGDERASIVLAGVDDVAGPRFGSAGPELSQAFAGAPDDLPRVLLSHNPVFFPRSRRHADLTLSGHTHGGQITLFVNPAKLVLRHGLVRGHYAVGDSQLYVNRGFGTAGPPARIGSPPEITKLVLTT